jgi:ribosomal protein L11 methyltransferase
MLHVEIHPPSMSHQAFLQLNLEIPTANYDAMVALLSEMGYYAFEETPSVLKAFIMESDYREEDLTDMVNEMFPGMAFQKTLERIEPKDWNAEWEANFHSVSVGDFCEVHPPHRPPNPAVKHHVMVAPKMAFGTGHHATTWLMMQACSRMDFQGKSVLDMGCGTGVLGILAHQLGASKVTLVDVDPWSQENTIENAQLNGILDLAQSGLEVILGDASSIPDQRYQIILANINRNVLMTDRDRMLNALSDGGMIVISGFYDFDGGKVSAHFSEAGLRKVEHHSRESWVMLAFEKPSSSARNT